MVSDLYNVGLATDFKSLSKDQVSEKEPDDPIYISAGVREKVAEAFFSMRGDNYTRVDA